MQTFKVKAIKPLKACGASIDAWIKEATSIGSQVHHANIIGQAIDRNLRNQNA